MRKVLIAVGVLVVLGVASVGALLLSAHSAIRRERGPLPSTAGLSAAISAADGPVSLSVIHTATQAMPRSGVLEPELDPHPDAAYVMTHPAFVLEWADGRILLVDVGMTHDGALAFAKPLEALGMAETIQPRRSAAAALGSAAQRVHGVVFSHLHIDHVDGIDELCAARGGEITVFMTEAQAQRTNYTTQEGLARIRAAGCTRIEELRGGPAFALQGFPGVAVVAAGGHTPGSQLIAAHVAGTAGSRNWMFAGDIINHIDGVNHQIGKPWYYSMFIVPEDRERLAELRQYLKELQSADFAVLAAHDFLNSEALGVPPYAPHELTNRR